MSKDELMVFYPKSGAFEQKPYVVLPTKLGFSGLEGKILPTHKSASRPQLLVSLVPQPMLPVFVLQVQQTTE